MIVIISPFQWRSQDNQHVYKRVLNEEEFVVSERHIAFERAKDRGDFMSPLVPNRELTPICGATSCLCSLRRRSI